MLRTPLKQCYAKSLLARKQCQTAGRGQSTSSGERGGSSFAKVGLLIGTASAATVVGTAAYAMYDSTFRSQLEETIPYSDKALELIIGKSEGKLSKENLPSKQQASAVKMEPSLLQIKRDREELAKKAAAASSIPSPPLSEPKQPAKTVNKTETKNEVPLVAKDTEAKSVPSTSSSTQPTGNEAKEEANTSDATNLPPGNSPLVGSSTRTIARQEDLKRKTEKREKAEENDKPSTSLEKSSFAVAEKGRLNEELREQLKLQLAAYSDYLKEQLQLQKQELTRFHGAVIEERLTAEKMKYQRELVASIGRLRELEDKLALREKLDIDENKSRELWLVCQLLTDALKSDPGVGTSSGPKPLFKEIKAVIDRVNSLESSSDKGSLAQLALISLPKAALESGIYSEDALIARFNQIDKLCKRVSLIGDEGGSLWRWALSYIQSALVIDRTRISKEELDDELVSPGSWDTYAILARVRHHLSHRNLEMSLRYANQLKGEPRRVANDWIKDVRAHLETRQAASILLSHASSMTVRTLSD